MELRPLLVVIVIGVSSGCIGVADYNTAPAKASDSAVPNPTGDTTNRTFPDLDNPGQTTNISIGGQNHINQYKLHKYTIINTGTSQKNIRIKIWQNTTTLMTRTINLTHEESASILLYRRANYTIKINPKGGPSMVANQDDWSWDCNKHAKIFALFPNGTIASRESHTLMKCE